MSGSDIVGAAGRLKSSPVLRPDFLSYFPTSLLSNPHFLKSECGISSLVYLNSALNVPRGLQELVCDSTPKAIYADQEISRDLDSQANPVDNEISAIIRVDETYDGFEDDMPSFVFTNNTKLVTSPSRKQQIMNHDAIDTTFINLEDNDENTLLCSGNATSITATPSKSITKSLKTITSQEPVDNVKLTKGKLGEICADSIYDDEVDDLANTFFSSACIRPNDKNPEVDVKYDMVALKLSSKQPYIFSNSGSTSIQTALHLWLRENRKNGGPLVVACSSATKSLILSALVSEVAHSSNPSERQALTDVTNSNETRSPTTRRLSVKGRTLIIANKQQIEKWADPCRAEVSTKLLMYTDTLSNRRKLSVSTIARHDFVITTYEILRAKEVIVPEENISAISGSSKKHDSSSEWLYPRDGECLTHELSSLHMIHWHTVIIDYTDVTIRSGSVRGQAVIDLHSQCKIGVVSQLKQQNNSFLSPFKHTNRKRERHNRDNGNENWTEGNVYHSHKYVSIATPNDKHTLRGRYNSEIESSDSDQYSDLEDSAFNIPAKLTTKSVARQPVQNENRHILNNPKVSEVIQLLRGRGKLSIPSVTLDLS